MTAALVVLGLSAFGSVAVVCFTVWRIVERRTVTAPARELLERLEKVEQRLAREGAEKMLRR